MAIFKAISYLVDSSKSKTSGRKQIYRNLQIDKSAKKLILNDVVIVRLTLSFLVALVSAPYLPTSVSTVQQLHTAILHSSSTGVSSMCRTKYLTAKLHLFASLTAALISKNDVEHFLKIGRTYSVMYIFQTYLHL